MPRQLQLAGKSRGYSLMELMLAIGLLGIVATFAIRTFQGYRQRANNVAAVTQISTMSTIIANYWNDHRTYPASLVDAGLGAPLDPWGHPYVYYNINANGKGHARKDHALNPINTDFDLYSDGPDGQTKPQITQKDSLDDLIRARDGAFIGVASDF